MITIKLIVIWPNGHIDRDCVSGNTQRVVNAAASGLARSYELDGCTVEIVR